MSASHKLNKAYLWETIREIKSAQNFSVLLEGYDEELMIYVFWNRRCWDICGGIFDAVKWFILEDEMDKKEDEQRQIEMQKLLFSFLQDVYCQGCLLAKMSILS